MNVITLASRKGGAGKSTLTAQLAACAHAAGRRCLVIDADPQGSLALWHALRADGQPPLQSAERGIERALAFAMIEGYDWVFIDTAPDHVGGGAGGDPRRHPGGDPGAARLLRSRRGARDGGDRARAQQALCGGAQRRAGQARRQGGAGGGAVARLSRAGSRSRSGPARSASAPAWRSRSRPARAPARSSPDSAAAAEIAGLWSAVERSVEAINAAHAAARAGRGSQGRAA